MQFPLVFELGPLTLSAHLLCELAAYVVGFALLRRELARHGDVLGYDARWTLNVAAIFGAIVGSKLVHVAGDPAALAQHASELTFWLGGKSMVGGLIGGVGAVELAKMRLRITRRTGDALVLPLIAGIAIGRVGCFAAGLSDHTFGVATNLPWGVDFGDGVERHPTQLYELAFLAALGVALTRNSTRNWREGTRFDAFFFAYLAFRLAVDFLKPYERFEGLAATQWACAVGLVARCVWLARSPRVLAQGAPS